MSLSAFAIDSELSSGWNEQVSTGNPSGLANSWYSSLLDLVGRGQQFAYYWIGGSTTTSQSTYDVRSLLASISRTSAEIGKYLTTLYNSLSNGFSLLDSDLDVSNTHLDHIDDSLLPLSFDSNSRLKVTSDSFSWLSSNLPNFYSIWADRTDFDLPNLSQLNSATAFAQYHAFFSLDDFSSVNHIIDSVNVGNNGLVGLLNIINSNIVQADSLLFTPTMTYFANRDNDSVNIISIADWFSTLGQWSFDSIYQLQKVLADDDDLALKEDTSNLVSTATDSFFSGSSGSRLNVSTISDVSSLSSGLQDLGDSGGSVSSFFGAVSSDSSVWAWFTQETADDLDSVQPPSSKRSICNDPNIIVTHYVDDNKVLLHSMLGSDIYD